MEKKDGIPLVSVIVPIYNVVDYLEQCILSITNQSYYDMQIILVDDGSTDGSEDICDRYELLDDRIEVIHKLNSGVSDARNYGLNCARGDYIAFVDSDDWVEPDMISVMVSEMNSDVDLVVAGFYVERTNERVIGNAMANLYKNGEKVLCDSRRALGILLEDKMDNFLWNKMYKKELFQNGNLRFPKSMTFEDVAIMHKIFMQAKNVCFINVPVYHYNIRKNGITGQQSVNNTLDHCEVRVKRYEDLYTTVPEYRESQWKGIETSIIRMVATDLLNRVTDKDYKKKKKEIIIRRKKIQLFVKQNSNGMLKKMSLSQRIILFLCIQNQILFDCAAVLFELILRNVEVE